MNDLREQAYSRLDAAIMNYGMSLRDGAMLEAVAKTVQIRAGAIILAKITSCSPSPSGARAQVRLALGDGKHISLSLQKEAVLGKDGFPRPTEDDIFLLFTNVDVRRLSSADKALDALAETLSDLAIKACEEDRQFRQDVVDYFGQGRQVLLKLHANHALKQCVGMFYDLHGMITSQPRVQESATLLLREAARRLTLIPDRDFMSSARTARLRKSKESLKESLKEAMAAGLSEQDLESMLAEARVSNVMEVT